MNEWENVRHDLAHINLNDEKKLMNYIMWDTYVKPHILFTGEKINDWGCGGGLFYSWVQKFRPKEYNAIDISTRSLKECLKVVNQYKNNVNVKIHNAKYAPINQPDIIICFAVIQHMTMKQLNCFIDYCEKSGAKEIFIQIRYNKTIQVNNKNLIYRLSLPEIKIKGYRIAYESIVIPQNKYKYIKYELLRNSISKTAFREIAK